MITELLFFGYNSKITEHRDRLKVGATRIALQNAASVSSLLLTTEAAIAEKPDDKEGAIYTKPGLKRGPAFLYSG